MISGKDEVASVVMLAMLSPIRQEGLIIRHRHFFEASYFCSHYVAHTNGLHILVDSFSYIVLTVPKDSIPRRIAENYF